MDVRQCWVDYTRTKCHLCLKALNNPRTLPCLHSFCLKCLENLVHVDGTRRQGEVECPTCMSPFQVTEKFIDDLPIPFLSGRFKDTLLNEVIQGNIICSNCEGGMAAISFCYVCRHYFCFRCDQAHHRLEYTRGHRNILLENVHSLLRRLAMCREENHQEEPLSLYCQECRKCVCQVCYEESHWQHVVENVQDATEPKKQQINETLVQLEREIAALNDKIKESQETVETRKEEINAARRIVEAYVNEAIRSLEKHKEAMLTELDDIYAKLQQRHAAKQDKLELLVQQLKSSVKYGKGILKRNYDVEILKEREAVINRCVYLLISRQDWDSFQFPCVKYIVDKKTSFENVRDLRPGRVMVSNADPIESPSNVHVGSLPVYQRAFQLESDAYLDESSSSSGIAVCETSANIAVADRSLDVQVTALHQYERVGQLGSDGFGHGTYYSPRGIATCKTSGNIAVADGIDKRVTIFSSEGKYLRHFGDVRDHSKNLMSPKSVAFRSSGEIVVVDSCKMILCSNRGVFLNYVLGVALPESVSTSSNGQMIVCDQREATVKVLHAEGGLVKSFSSDRTLDGQPCFAIKDGDKIIVSYPKAHCVKVFSDNGAFLYDIGTKGCEREMLDKPQGLAIDRFNNLVVCDSNKSRLQVYKPDGRHVATVEGENSKLVSPQFVAVSKDGHLFVTDSGRKRGQPFNLDAKQSCIHIFY